MRPAHEAGVCAGRVPARGEGPSSVHPTRRAHLEGQPGAPLRLRRWFRGPRNRGFGTQSAEDQMNGTRPLPEQRRALCTRRGRPGLDNPHVKVTRPQSALLEPCTAGSPAAGPRPHPGFPLPGHPRTVRPGHGGPRGRTHPRHSGRPCAGHTDHLMHGAQLSPERQLACVTRPTAGTGTALVSSASAACPMPTQPNRCWMLTADAARAECPVPWVLLERAPCIRRRAAKERRPPRAPRDSASPPSQVLERREVHFAPRKGLLGPGYVLRLKPVPPPRPLFFSF